MSKRNIILIVEDEPLWLDVLINIAQINKGYSIKHANSFTKACKWINKYKNKIALLITDIRLDTNDNRNIDGLHIINKMINENFYTDFIIISYFINNEVKKFAMKNNIKYYLKQDLNQTNLSNYIESLLNKNKQIYKRKMIFRNKHDNYYINLSLDLS